MPIKRWTRSAGLLFSAVLIAGAIAGTAWGGTSAWQDIWSQIKPLLASPGTINSQDNPVHWTKLKGVPAGFADGLDNGIDKAGYGLKKSVFPNLEFAVDTSKIQQRVTGTCPEGRAVRAVGADGAVSCSDPGVIVYEGWDVATNLSTGGEVIGNDWASIGGALDLPAGAWSLVAKMVTNGGENPAVSCRLDVWVNGAVSVRDYSDAFFANDYGHRFGSATIPLTGVYESTVPFKAAVVCRDFASNAYWQNVMITATRAAEIHRQQLG